MEAGGRTTSRSARILLLLAVAVGLPYLLLSATSPLVQAWFARERPEANPYRLFALSNVASLAALIGYPLLVEPWLTNSEQVSGWSWLFALFALACAVLAWRGGGKRSAAPAAIADAPPPARRDVLHWLALSATGSAMLLAVTNHLTQNVAAIPLLWIAPLTLYLVTFILAFEGGLYRSEYFWSFCLAWLMGMAWLLVDTNYQFDLLVQLGMFLSGLFVTCLFCHGELYRLRPAAAPPDRVLPDGVRRGRTRRAAGGGGGAARLQRLLRARPVDDRGGVPRRAALRHAAPGGAQHEPRGADGRHRRPRSTTACASRRTCGWPRATSTA